MTKLDTATPTQFSRQELESLAKIDRYLITSILAGILVPLSLIFLPHSLFSGTLFLLMIPLKFIIGMTTLYFYGRLLYLGKLGTPLVWIILIFFLIALSLVIKGMQGFIWIIIFSHIIQAHNKIFKPNGYKMGFLGPVLKS